MKIFKAFKPVIYLCLLFLAITSCQQKAIKPTDLVNPFIDTHKCRWFFFSSASRPFGMVNLSPDTRTKGSWKSGYLYDSLNVRCFSHVHAWQMSGIPVMPTVGEFKGHLGMDAYKSSFKHETEIARPGYHKVVLDDYNITAELTSTTRVGFHKYQFPKNEKGFVIFDTGAYLAHSKMDSSMVFRVNDNEIAGFSLMGRTGRRPKPTYVYFVARFNQPISEFGGWKNKKIITTPNNKIAGKNCGAFVSFDQMKDENLLMKVAISYTNIEQARLNLETELAHWDFDKVVKESDDEWNKWLSKIEIKGGTEKQQVKFYTDLWHSLLGRRIVSDVDGKFCDMTGEKPAIRQMPLNAEGKPKNNFYNFDAWWGSHWTLNVLWSMAYPEMMDEFCNSMVEMYNHGGLIPRGPSGGNYTYVMIGDPAVSFFATAYNKGIRNYDIQKAYEGLRKNAFVGGIRDRAGYEHRDNPQGGGMGYYVEQGYVPEYIKGPGGHKDGASMTLEYAYQDWCLAQIAKATGNNSDYELFNKRSKNYKKLWNPETRFIHPRMKDGSWIENFEPIGDGFHTLGFCESNSAIYTNFVPHDLPGLMELFGGKEKYTEYLSECFRKAAPMNYITDHGKHAQNWVDYENQPSCQMAHLFNYTGAPWLSQKWVREVKETTFGDTTPYGGYNGDEDQGQMGALGVLMSIGMFQMDGGCSVDSKYDITTPLFDEVKIHLNPKYYTGKTFTIKTNNNSKENMYIQSAKLNGKEWNSFQFSHSDFAKGGKIELNLGSQPNKNWGINQ
ncbi:glycoside hydrolase family 92 protein [Prolixibacteraceae bacterium JC049]|nr:glycoside hydrolase family 92 protein [Prolixibacteraceae bacterium JC049]